MKVILDSRLLSTKHRTIHVRSKMDLEGLLELDQQVQTLEWRLQVELEQLMQLAREGDLFTANQRLATKEEWS